MTHSGADRSPRRRLHRRRQPQDAADARQLRLHRDARDEQPDRSPRSAGLARLRSGSVGRIRVCGARGAVAPRSSRGPRAGIVSQDVGRPRPPRVRAAAARRAAGSGARVRRGDRPGAGGAAPRLVTVEARKARRRAPVYLDVMRNAGGQTIVPPFSVRWQPCAPVSMPLSWDEVSPRLNPGIFNIRTAERRMARKSPWAKFFGHRQTLPRI